MSKSFAITQIEFTKKVLSQKGLLEEASIGLEIKQIELNASRNNYVNWKINLSSELAYDYSDLDRNTNSNYTYTGKDKSYPKSINISAKKRFLTHRGNLEFIIASDKDKSIEQSYKQQTNTAVYQLNKTVNTQRIRYQYPLLKHDSNASSLKTYHRDIIDLKRQKLSFYETKEDILLKQLLDYLSWIHLDQIVAVYQNLLLQLKQIKIYQKNDSLIQESTVLKHQNQLANYQNKLKSITAKIAVLIDDNAILTQIPTVNLLQTYSVFSATKVISYLQKHSRDLERIVLDIKLKEINIAYYKNRTLPELNFSLALEKTLNKRNTKTSIYNDNRTDYEVALVFNYPLTGDILNQSSLDKDKLGIRKLEISHQDKQQDILADADKLGALLVVNYSQLNKNIDLAIRLLQLETQNYEIGQTSIRDFLQAHQDLVDAKLFRLSTLIAYQNSGLKYQALLDKLVELDCPNGLSDCYYQ